MNAITKNVYWDVLILMILSTFIPGEIFFLISCAYLMCLVVKNKMEIIIPNVAGFKLYLFVILYTFFAGLIFWDLRSVARDMYYFSSTFVWIWIGVFAAFLDWKHKKDFYKTLFLYGGFVSIKTFANFIIHFSLVFDDLKTIFGQNVYDIGFVMPVAVIQIIFFDRVFINKKLDYLIVLLMSLHIFLSFGRIAILQPLLFIFSAMVVAIESTRHSTRILRKITMILFGAIILLIAGFYIVPESVSSVFFSKVMNSFAEINTQQKITSVGDAMQNWRGYEIQAAQQQWLDSNIIVQLFGNGMGKGVEIRYVPYTWEGMVVNNQIPLLHNGFYTILIKGGLLGVTALIVLLAWPLVKGIKLIKLHKNDGVDCILVGSSVAAIANTYVVRGPIQQGAFLVWALLIGWLTGYFVFKKNTCE